MILTKKKIDKIDVNRLINDRIKNRRLNEILFIVPTRRKIRYYTRELISVSPEKSVADLKIETIGSFAQRLLSDSLGEENLISDEASILLLNHCFNDAGLKYFSQYKNQVPFGTLERIKNVIAEYKRHGISPDRLREEAQSLSGTEKFKALDIAEVYERYQHRLRKINLRETGDIYSDLNRLEPSVFESRFKESYPGVNLVVINGFDEFTAPETEIINSTAEIKGTDLFVLLDYYKYNPLIFSHLDECHHRFVNKGFREVKDISTEFRPEFINSVRENLSLKSKPGIIKSFNDKLTVITARSREEEIELTAKQIKILLISGKTDPDKICVVFNLIEKYSPLIRSKFPLLGIPYNLTDRFSLSTSEPVKGIIHLLEIVENDFYYKNIIRSQSNYFAGIEGINLSNLLKVSVELKIVSGYSSWTGRINEAINELSEGYRADDNNPEKIENFKLAEKDIQKIKKTLEPFNQKMTPGEFSRNVLQLIYLLNFPQKILKAEPEVVEKDLKALSTFIDSLKNISAMLELEFGKNIKFDLRFYLSQLKTLAAFSRYNIAEKPGYGVQVTTLNEIRGLKFDFLFICGMNDGDLPTRFSPEVFFSGSFAREENRHQVEERYLFYQALCTWQKGLYLSYSLYEERKELVQSSFLQDFLNLFSVQRKNHESFSGTIFSRKELLEHIGKLPDKERTSLKLSESLNLDLKRINDSISVDRIRQEDPFGRNEYSGYIGNMLPDNLKERLEAVAGSRFSATQLETYAKCPYKFFLENILLVQSIGEPLEELEAFELGSLIHIILYEFYSQLKERGIKLQNCSEADFKTAENFLFGIALSKLEKLNLGSDIIFREREKLLGTGSRKDSILYKFLEKERDNEDGYVPSFFEFGFGGVRDENAKKAAAQNEIKLDKIRLRGKIDRIDLNPEFNTLKVIDYKSGGLTPTNEDVREGIALQLPLYLFAAKELISAQLGREYRPAGAEIFSLKYAEKDFGRNEVRAKRKVKDEDINSQINSAGEMINICIDAVKAYVKNISEGRFNLSALASRESKVCRYCDFRKICRIQEVDS